MPAKARKRKNATADFRILTHILCVVVKGGRRKT